MSMLGCQPLVSLCGFDLFADGWRGPLDAFPSTEGARLITANAWIWKACRGITTVMFPRTESPTHRLNWIANTKASTVAFHV